MQSRFAALGASGGEQGSPACPDPGRNTPRITATRAGKPEERKQRREIAFKHEISPRSDPFQTFSGNRFTFWG